MRLVLLGDIGEALVANERQRGGFGQFTSANSYNVEILFRNSYLQNATDLSIAANSIHESLHAVFVYMYEEGLLVSENGSALVAYEDYVEAYINHLHNISTTEDSAHELMAEFVEDIATSLSAYGQSAGYSLPYSYYYRLSWAGMTHTQLFDELYPVYIEGTTSDKLERLQISKTIRAEQENEMQEYIVNGTSYQILPEGSAPNETEPCD